jgi:hypothetical protein
VIHIPEFDQDSAADYRIEWRPSDDPGEPTLASHRSIGGNMPPPVDRCPPRSHCPQHPPATPHSCPRLCHAAPRSCRGGQDAPLHHPPPPLLPVGRPGKHDKPLEALFRKHGVAELRKRIDAFVTELKAK